MTANNPYASESDRPSTSTIRIVGQVIKWVLFVVTLAGLLILWGFMGWALLQSRQISDDYPFFTPGVIELFSYALGALTISWLTVVLIWRFFGRFRWYALAATPILAIVGMVLLLQQYRIVFDADMNPIRLDPIAADYDLESGEGIIEKSLQVRSTDFPRFLGAEQDLKIPWLTWTSEFKNASAYQVLWRQPVGHGWSGFIVVDDIAFTMEQVGPWECVTARHLESGKLIWQHRDRHRHDEPAGGIGPRSTPTFHQGKLFTLGAHGTLNCLNANSGEVLWSLELTKEFDIPLQVYNEETDQQYDMEESDVMWGRAASPLIVGDNLVVPVGGRGTKGDSAANANVSLAAFSQDDGSLVWKGGDQQISYGSPTLATLGGRQQILITNEATVTGHDPENGTVLWTHARPGDSDGSANTSQPITLSDRLVLLSKEYGLGGELIEVVQQEGQWQTESLWKNPRVLKTKLTVPVIQGEYSYSISGGILECCHWETGERMWRGERVQHGQLLLVDNHLLVVSEQGTLMLIPATPDQCEVVFQMDDILAGRCWNMLCIAGDKLLARSELEATCIQLPVEVTSDAALAVDKNGSSGD